MFTRVPSLFLYSFLFHCSFLKPVSGHNGDRLNGLEFINIHLKNVKCFKQLGSAFKAIKLVNDNFLESSKYIILSIEKRI